MAASMSLIDRSLWNYGSEGDGPGAIRARHHVSGPQRSGPTPRQSIHGVPATSAGSISSPARRRNSATSTTLWARPRVSPSTRTRRPPVGDGGCTITRIASDMPSGSSGACGPAFQRVIDEAAHSRPRPSVPDHAVPATPQGPGAAAASRDERTAEPTAGTDACATRYGRAARQAAGRWHSTPAAPGLGRRETVAWPNSSMCSIFRASKDLVSGGGGQAMGTSRAVRLAPTSNRGRGGESPLSAHQGRSTYPAGRHRLSFRLIHRRSRTFRRDQRPTPALRPPAHEPR